MARERHKLTAAQVRLAGPGKHSDGGGLMLVVKSESSRIWSLRYMLNGKAREMGLGSALDVSLTEARNKAAAIRLKLASGVDPLDERLTTAEARKREAARLVTFEVAARDFIATHESSWSNAKHQEQWRRTLEMFVFPIFGAKPVAEVTVEDVLTALKPIWSKKPETARRVRMRVEKVLSAAIARGLRSGPNPAAWRDNLAHLLPTIGRASRVLHYDAMPFSEAPGFLKAIRARDSISARCVELVLYTAVRSGEAREARIDEFDLDGATWEIPAERMKARSSYRVPLVPRVVEIVRELQPLSERAGGLLFVSQGDAPLTQTALVATFRKAGGLGTVHGIRSCFRDWSAETTNYPNIVCEMALAHSVAGVEGAYRRGDLFDKRRALMDDWASYLEG